MKDEKKGKKETTALVKAQPVKKEDKQKGATGKKKRKKKKKKAAKAASVAQKVLDALGDLSLFEDEESQPCGVVPVGNHSETHRIRSRSFKRWLCRQIYNTFGKIPNSETITSVLNILEAKAVFDGPCYKLSFRVAEENEIFLYDLGDKRRRVIEITERGWCFGKHPFAFQRGANTSAQVEPIRGGDVRLVLKFLNLPKKGDQLLLLVMIIAALVPGIPHPILLFIGEHGAAKSTATRVIRLLVDPAVEPLLSLPSKPEDMALILHKNYCPALDNLDGLQGWQSDILCRAVTGGGIAKRRLYTDDEEVILKFLRFIILNGINPSVTKPDLIDRTTPLTLERISEEQRREEKEFWKAFEKVRPLIFGGMLDTLSLAMKIYPTVKLDKLPRMADFCKWGYAIGEALGGKGAEFLKAYWESIGHQNTIAIENHPVASAIQVFMNEQYIWEGRPSDLLAELEEIALKEKIDTKAHSWPKAAHILTRRLNTIKTNLMGIGIKIVVGEHTGAKRIIRLEKFEQNSVSSDEASDGGDTSGNPVSGKDGDATDADNAIFPPSDSKEDDPDEF